MNSSRNQIKLRKKTFQAPFMKKISAKIAFPVIIYFALDQGLKWLAAEYLRTPLYLTSWFSLRYEENYGIAWSIPVQHGLLLLLNVVLLAAIPLYVAKHIDLRKKEAQIFLGFILGGATGNLADRLIKGYVVDYISIGSFPVFNLADSLLSVGIFLIIVFYGRIRRVSRT